MNFNQSMLQTVHEDHKESYQLVEDQWQETLESNIALEKTVNL